MKIRAVIPAMAVVGLALMVMAATNRADPEVARVQQHLLEVEAELLERDLSDLSAEQRESRAQNIAVLRQYRERGIFPHNHDFPERKVPYFVDAHGTHCAMAYLIARSGRADLVERIAGSHNNAYVPDLADDPELIAWLDDAGLTPQEAARIQPSYQGPYFEPEEAVETSYVIGRLAASGLAGLGVGLNFPGDDASPSRWRSGVGVAGGALAVVLGARDVNDDSDLRTSVGIANLGLGLASMGLSIRSFLRIDDPAATGPEQVSERSAPGHTDGLVQYRLSERSASARGSAGMHVHAAPWLSAAADGWAPGLSLRMTF